MGHDAYLALGSNMGDRERNLLDAVLQISDMENTVLKAISGIYETKPVGYLEQEDFLNMALAIETELNPPELLDKLQEIEKLLKRTREIRWGPRTIDIDILLYGDLKINTPELIIPHPRIFERAFVLRPLKDIYMGADLCGMDIDELISKCEDRNDIRLYKKITL